MRRKRLETAVLERAPKRIEQPGFTQMNAAIS
jgi:hypothetical protein